MWLFSWPRRARMKCLLFKRALIWIFCRCSAKAIFIDNVNKDYTCSASSFTEFKLISSHCAAACRTIHGSSTQKYAVRYNSQNGITYLIWPLWSPAFTRKKIISPFTSHDLITLQLKCFIQNTACSFQSLSFSFSVSFVLDKKETQDRDTDSHSLCYFYRKHCW